MKKLVLVIAMLLLATHDCWAFSIGKTELFKKYGYEKDSVTHIKGFEMVTILTGATLEELEDWNITKKVIYKEGGKFKVAEWNYYRYLNPPATEEYLVDIIDSDILNVAIFQRIDIPSQFETDSIKTSEYVSEKLLKRDERIARLMVIYEEQKTRPDIVELP